MKRFLAMAILIGPLALGPATAVVAQSAAQPDYHPSLADLMTIAVQSRHTKIGLAGKARNWPYLAYEVNELKNAFNRIARTVPVYSKQPLDPLIESGIRPQISQLEAAVKAQDARRFDAAYAAVTEGCNNCHAALEKTWIVIRAPSGDPYPDQVLGRSR